MGSYSVRIVGARLSIMFLSRDRQTSPVNDCELVTLGATRPGYSLVPGKELYESTACNRYCFILSNVLSKKEHI